MRALREEREAAQAWEDNDIPKRYGLGMLIGLLGIAFCIGDVVGHVTATARPAMTTTFAPGRYLFEEPELGWLWAVRFDNPWTVSVLPEPTP